MAGALNPRDEILKIAEGEVGVREDRPNHVKYNTWYYGREVEAENKESSAFAWCAVFVCWCARMAGIPEDVIPRFAYCPNGVSFYQKAGRYTEKCADVRKGDIIFFNWYGKNTASHLGLVLSVENGKIRTVEGNRSDQVKICTYETGDERIIGCAHPDYGFGSGIVDHVEDSVETEIIEEVEIRESVSVKNDDNTEKTPKPSFTEVFRKIVEIILKLISIFTGKEYRP